jgi:hypothetical protein
VHAYTSTADYREKVCTYTHVWIGNLEYQEVEETTITVSYSFYSTGAKGVDKAGKHKIELG